MAITFKVKEQKLTTARGEQTFFFAKAVSNGETSIEQLQKLIAKISAISEGDVRSVLMTLTQLVALELSQGRIVSLGDLGRLRVGLKSKGGDSKEKFRSQDIKKVRVIFVPGALIKDNLLSASFKRSDDQAKQCSAQNSKKADEAGTTAEAKPENGGKGKKKDESDKDYTGL